MVPQAHDHFKATEPSVDVKQSSDWEVISHKVGPQVEESASPPKASPVDAKEETGGKLIVSSNDTENDNNQKLSNGSSIGF